MLRDIVLKKIQEANSYHTNQLLNSINLSTLNIIEDRKEDVYLQEAYKKLITILETISMSISDAWKDFYQLYGEIEVYLYLSSLLQINKVTERNDLKTPDFRINYKNREYYLEVKTPLMADATEKYKDISNKGLQNNVKSEEELEYNSSSVTEQTISPYSKHRKEYHLHSKLSIINVLIDKACQNIKEGQYINGETILLLNIRQLGISASEHNAALPYFYENKSVICGELWHTCFGRQGQYITKPPEFRGKSNYDGYLEKNGILIDNTAIKGVIFQVSWIPEKREYIGFYRNEDYNIGDLIDYICSISNTDNNKNELKLIARNCT